MDADGNTMQWNETHTSTMEWKVMTVINYHYLKTNTQNLLVTMKDKTGKTTIKQLQHAMPRHIR